MTAIAGFCDKGKVWIGGDSAGLEGWDLTVRSDKKVFRNRDFIFGFTSSFRMGQLIQYSFVPPKHKEEQDVFAYMVTDFVDALRSCLKAGGYAKRTNEEESAGTFLVGYRARLFRVDDDYQIGEPADGYVACGCGQAIATGALFATRGMQPEKRMQVVLGAAANHSGGVRAPFTVESI